MRRVDEKCSKTRAMIQIRIRTFGGSCVVRHCALRMRLCCCRMHHVVAAVPPSALPSLAAPPSLALQKQCFGLGDDRVVHGCLDFETVVLRVAADAHQLGFGELFFAFGFMSASMSACSNLFSLIVAYAWPKTFFASVMSKLKRRSSSMLQLNFSWLCSNFFVAWRKGLGVAHLNLVRERQKDMTVCHAAYFLQIPWTVANDCL